MVCALQDTGGVTVGAHDTSKGVKVQGGGRKDAEVEDFGGYLEGGGDGVLDGGGAVVDSQKLQIFGQGAGKVRR